MHWVILICFAAGQFQACKPLEEVTERNVPSFDNQLPCEDFAKKNIKVSGAGYSIKCIEAQKVD